MKIILRYIALPFLILGAVLGTIIYAVKMAWSYSPISVITTLVAISILIILKAYSVRRDDLRRGWRVGHAGRDQMFYEEMVAGRWERIEIDGEMQCGDEHPQHLVWLSTAEEWGTLPEWSHGRRSEIIARIKSMLTPPEYEYEEAEQGGNSDAEEAV